MAALALGACGAGLVIWSHRLMPAPIREEERHPMASSAETRQALVSELFHDGAIGRRRMLSWLLAAAAAGVAALFLAPLLSLGPTPGKALYQTSWRKGRRLVDIDGRLIHADDVPLGSLTTVFPEGAAGVADSQAILLHLDPASLELRGDALQLGAGGVRDLLQAMHACRLPGGTVPGPVPASHLPLPPIHLRCRARRRTDLRTGRAPAAAVAHAAGDRMGRSSRWVTSPSRSAPPSGT